MANLSRPPLLTAAPEVKRDVTAFMQVTTISLPPFIALTRPPLYNSTKQSAPLGSVDVYPSLSTTTLKAGSTPKFRQQSDSAPVVQLRPQVDAYSNLSSFTLHTPSPTLVIEQLFQSAPSRIISPQVDRYPNLSVTTLAASLTPKFVKISDSASVVQQRPQVDVYPNLVRLLTQITNALQSHQWFDSAPQRWIPPQVDVYPNLLWTTLRVISLPLSAARVFDSAPPKIVLQQVDFFPHPSFTTLAPIPSTIRSLTTPAPIRARRPEVDVYPNLLSTTLNPSVSSGTPLFVEWSAGAPSRRIGLSAVDVYVDVYPNLLTKTLGPPPAPPAQQLLTPIGRYLTHAHLRTELSSGELSVTLSAGLLICQLSLIEDIADDYI